MSAEALLDPRFAALPRLFRDATKPNPSVDDVRRFMHELVQADTGLFEGGLLFRAREARGFLFIADTGIMPESPRHWSRWPLHRLFSTRRACLITSPETEERALAFPFNVSVERYVVIAPLRTQSLCDAQTAFLQALQAVTCAPPVPATRPDISPRFVWVGADAELLQRVARLIGPRGWDLLYAPTFGHALMLLERDAVDIAIVDSRTLGAPLSSLRSLRHTAKISDAPILYFSNEAPGTEIQALIDEWLKPSASDAELLRTFKNSAQLISESRTRALRISVEKADGRLRACSGFDELAQTCADAAVHLGCDAAGVMLVDELEEIHSACVGASAEALTSRWPTPFVTGDAVLHSRADDRFFEEVFYDAEYAGKLRQLQVTSAAALPISDGVRIVGTLLAISRERPMFEPEFGALAELCRRTGTAFAALPRPELTRGIWRRTAIPHAAIDVYQGMKAGATFYLRNNESAAALVVLEHVDEGHPEEFADDLLRELLSCADEQDAPERMRSLLLRERGNSGGILIASIDKDDRLTYACSAFPNPLRVPESGPFALRSHAGTLETGCMRLDERSATLIYSNSFASQVDAAQAVGALQRALRDGQENPARALPELAQRREKLAFASITRPSSAAGSRRPQVLA